MKRLKIYVAGPYTPSLGEDRHDMARIAHQNTINAIRVAENIINRGHIPFVPHLTHFMHLYSKETLSYKFFTIYDIEWLRDCDALFFIGSSPGADKELEWAKNNGLSIYYNLIEVPIGEPW